MATISPSPLRGEGGPEERDLHKIVLVGAGAGGLELATMLGDRIAARRAGPLAKVVLDTVSHWLRRQTHPRVKLH